MGFDNISNSGLQLDLGLGLGHDQLDNCMSHRESQKKKEDDHSCNNKAYPSLTLGPIDDDDEVNIQPPSKIEVSNSPSAVSSFSNSSSPKKVGGYFWSEEIEIEVEKLVRSRVGDVDEDGNSRKKLRLTKEQSAVLEENFKEHSTLNPKRKQELAKKLNLRTRQVEVWFQNRRARTKLKQTELDCELLKKCYETLTKENKRLQKELQELKSMQTTASEPCYMQIPATTICPSCERIWGGSGGNSISNGSSPTTTILLNGSKAHHHFHKNNYPFINTSSTTTAYAS